MATTLTRNLKLRLNSGLTADAKYNLERIDLLGSTFLTDSTDSLNIRSRTDINIEPDSADLGGNSTGGVVNIGSNSHSLDELNLYSDALNISQAIGLLDQGTSGTKYLRLKYNSTLHGAVDTAADRALSVDLEGADRSLVLGGDLTVLGGSLTLNLTGTSSVILPLTGTLSTLAGVETLTNKTINAPDNTITNIANSNIAVNAGIVYTKLNLTSSIVNGDVAPGAAIAYSKLNLGTSILDSDISPAAAISRSKIANGTAAWVVYNDGSGQLAAEEHLSKLRGGTGLDNTNVTFPSIGVLVTEAGAQTLTNKIIDGNNNTLTNLSAGSINLTDYITNAHVNSAAAIAYSKLNLAGSITDADISSVALIARTKIGVGTPDHVLINDSLGALSSEAQLSISRGGTGAATASAAINALLPSQAGNNGKVLQSNGSVASWQAIAGSGTVTSVAFSAPAEFTVSGSPVTSSGTLALTKANQSANTIWAGPTSGGAAAPSFRSLVDTDIPQLDHGGLAGLGDDDHTQYHTDARALTWLGTRSTADLPEGSNLYFTDERVDDRVAALLLEGAGIDLTYDDTLNTLTIASTITQYTDEMAQDAVGTILTDSSSIDFTYNDGAPSITAVVLPAGVNHNALANYVANEHVDHTSVQIATAATSGLSGGGTIAATRNITVDPTQATTAAPAAGDVILFADISNSNALRKTTVQDILDLGGGKVTATWITGDGTSKAVTHSFGVTTVSVTVFDIDSGEDILVDSIVRTDSNTVTLTSSQAPAGSGWTVIVRK